MKKIAFLLFAAFLALPASAQSTNQDFPAPVVRDEIAGTIAARDIGDARLTQHFYTFYADNGDLSLAVETENFAGDVDLFEARTLRPLAKITLYAADNALKTTRTVYFRQRAQVVLRVEGRTPNDEAARYRINLSGSFAAALDLPQPPEDLQIKPTDQSSGAVARVNSAGTILEVLTPPQKPAETTEELVAVDEKTNRESEEATARTTEETAAVTKKPEASKRTVPNRRPRRPAAVAKSKPENSETASTVEAPAKVPARAPRRTSPARKQAAIKPTGVSAAKVNPLATVRLLVLLKDGYKIERPMSEILRVSVDGAQLVVITKNGKIERFSILDVLKMTIEQ